MGTGIVGVVPIIFKPLKDNWSKEINPKYFSEKFFENYTFDKEKRVCTIKTDFLVKNYRDFLIEFYACIGEEMTIENLPDVSTYDEFEAVFDRNARNAGAPYLDLDGHFLDCVGGECVKCWNFYFGSYKAYLEVYSTLLHFERLLCKAINNPLANTVKIGIYG